MKKSMLAFLLMMGLMVNSFAQPGPAKKTTTKTTTAVPVKKDGTADMRFKTNKKKNIPMGPLKKDGTPDKRYKSNKKTA